MYCFWSRHRVTWLQDGAAETWTAFIGLLTTCRQDSFPPVFSYVISRSLLLAVGRKVLGGTDKPWLAL